MTRKDTEPTIELTHDGGPAQHNKGQSRYTQEPADGRGNIGEERNSPPGSLVDAEFSDGERAVILEDCDLPVSKEVSNALSLAIVKDGAAKGDEDHLVVVGASVLGDHVEDPTHAGERLAVRPVDVHNALDARVPTTSTNAVHLAVD